MTLENWSVVTAPTQEPRLWVSVIKRNGKLIQSIEYVGTQRAAEHDAQVTMRKLSRKNGKTDEG
ncbi:MAG: hypothetical protein CMH39_00445 [Micrococcales bacterium]|jgi:hypothetical protein|nr:hypothetical protein [Micrococcales bacterium]|tara:strand:- start:528 stop:719 length:192 start_codon:yes stop_codon:yes gene_type:complete